MVIQTEPDYHDRVLCSCLVKLTLGVTGRAAWKGETGQPAGGGGWIIPVHPSVCLLALKTLIQKLQSLPSHPFLPCSPFSPNLPWTAVSPPTPPSTPPLVMPTWMLLRPSRRPPAPTRLLVTPTSRPPPPTPSLSTSKRLVQHELQLGNQANMRVCVITA